MPANALRAISIVFLPLVLSAIASPAGADDPQIQTTKKGETEKVTFSSVKLVRTFLYRPSPEKSENWQICVSRGAIDPDLRIKTCTAVIKSGVSTASQLVVLYNSRGVAWQVKGDFDRAIADYDVSLSYDPKFAPGYKNRCRAYISKADIDSATRDCEVAVDLIEESQRRLDEMMKQKCFIRLLGQGGRSNCPIDEGPVQVPVPKLLRQLWYRRAGLGGSRALLGHA